MKSILRPVCLLGMLSLVVLPASAQWNLEWTSPAIPSATVSGWFDFRRDGDAWETRYFTLDSAQFRVMSGPLSPAVEYTYTFSAAERLAGEELYSMTADLTGDGIVEFYVLSAYGMASPYRQGMKIFDITTGTTVFERNTAGLSYSYPYLWDIDRDGFYEVIVTRSAFPSSGMYANEVYQTNTPAGGIVERLLPRRIGLEQNYPNPFNPRTRIEYDLPASGRVRLDILNLLGQHVRTLTDAPQTAGRHFVEWDGCDAGGLAQASGAYFYRLAVDGRPVRTKQMLLIR